MMPAGNAMDEVCPLGQGVDCDSCWIELDRHVSIWLLRTLLVLCFRSRMNSSRH